MRARGAARGAAIAIIAVAIAALLPAPARATARAGGLTTQQRAVLYGIAQDTWRFYAADVDPVTHLPLDNLGPGAVRGPYTSAANIGVYLWAVVAARDLGVIDNARVDTFIPHGPLLEKAACAITHGGQARHRRHSPPVCPSAWSRSDATN